MDREKVMEGLRHCADKTMEICNQTCPYFRCVSCETELATDALELIKELQEAGQAERHAEHDPAGGEERMSEITEEKKKQWKKESLERIYLNRLKTIENAKNAVIKVRDRHSDNFVRELRMNDTDMLLYSIANSLLAIAQGMK